MSLLLLFGRYCYCPYCYCLPPLSKSPNIPMRRGTEYFVSWTSSGWKDGGQRDNKAAGATNTPTISSLHTHTRTHAHARMTDLCVEAFAWLYERQTPCKMGFSPCKTCSFRESQERMRQRERERERVLKTLYCFSPAQYLSFSLTHTLARRLITLPTVYV